MYVTAAAEPCQTRAQLNALLYAYFTALGLPTEAVTSRNFLLGTLPVQPCILGRRRGKATCSGSTTIRANSLGLASVMVKSFAAP